MNNTILANPLDDQTVTSEGYVLNYGKYATGWITPEYGYWKNMNKKQALAEAEYLEAIDKTYEYLTVRELYNINVFKLTMLDTDSLPSIFPNF